MNDVDRENYTHLAEMAYTRRVRLQSITVQPGSEIAADNAYLNPVKRTFEEYVWQFLGSAIDHLRLIGEAGSRQPVTNPFAFATLARTAITTTATALWSLDSNQATRRVRILEVIAKDYASYEDYRRTVEPKFTSPEEVRKFDDETQELNRRASWLLAEYKSATGKTPTKLKSIGADVTDTLMVKAAGNFLDPAPFTNGLGPDAELLSMWQHLSGYAHGRPWAYQGAKTTIGPADANGQAPQTISGQPTTIISAAAAVLTLMDTAFDTADRLSDV
ncbi:hypothetical protein AB4Z55_27370 [Gordonia sp. ABKF26]|uniref:hypothetical protein n=1 Tax=Gordonia sp. ABKF26 TaxID=3238687 RepID=UPI0034E57EFD